MTTLGAVPLRRRCWSSAWKAPTAPAPRWPGRWCAAPAALLTEVAEGEDAGPSQPIRPGFDHARLWLPRPDVRAAPAVRSGALRLRGWRRAACEPGMVARRLRRDAATAARGMTVRRLTGGAAHGDERSFGDGRARSPVARRVAAAAIPARRPARRLPGRSTRCAGSPIAAPARHRSSRADDEARAGLPSTAINATTPESPAFAARPRTTPKR